MKLRIIQWNIKINCNIERVIDFIKKNITEKCIINLQEVSINNYNQLIDRINNNSAFSLSLRTPGIYEGKNRQMGIATFVIGGVIQKTYLLDRTVFPERTLITEIKMDSHYINNLAFHSLTGVDYKKAKSSNFATIASYLAENNRINIFSCDANEPKVDSIDDNKVEFYDNRDKGINAALLFGKNKVHSLVDSFKLYTKKHGGHLEDGVTHRTGSVNRRYDFVYHNPEWNVIRAESLYEDSLKATSDHAMLICDYCIPE